MADLVTDIVKYLTDNGIKTDGTALYGYLMQPTPDNAVSVAEYGGEKPEVDPSVHKPGLQIISRASTPAVARAKLQAIENLLNGLHAVTINGTYYTGIFAIQGATPLDPDGTRSRFVQNYRTARED